jgi:hypothetical protein
MFKIKYFYLIGGSYFATCKIFFRRKTEKCSTRNSCIRLNENRICPRNFGTELPNPNFIMISWVTSVMQHVILEAVTCTCMSFLTASPILYREQNEVWGIPSSVMWRHVARQFSDISCCCLLGLLFNPEKRCGVFLRNYYRITSHSTKESIPHCHSCEALESDTQKFG